MRSTLLMLMKSSSGLALGLALAACASTPPPDEPLMADPPPSKATAAASESKLDPEVQTAQELIDAGKFQDAIPHLKKALASNPKSASAAFYLGKCIELTNGDKAEVEKLYKQALAFDPKLSDAAVNLAAIYLADPPRPDDAIAVLDKALSYTKEDPVLLMNLGYAYSLKKENDKALAAYLRVVPNEKHLEPAVATQLHLELGTMLFQSKKTDEAVPHLLKAAKALWDDAPSLATIGRMLGYSKTSLDDCVRVFDRAIELKPNAEFLVRRGTCKHDLKQEKEAGKDFEAAIALDPKFQAAHYYYGLSLFNQDNKKGARSALKRAYELGKETPLGKKAKEKYDTIHP